LRLAAFVVFMRWFVVPEHTGASHAQSMIQLPVEIYYGLWNLSRRFWLHGHGIVVVVPWSVVVLEGGSQLL
jgi:hypothetical protein